MDLVCDFAERLRRRREELRAAHEANQLTQTSELTKPKIDYHAALLKWWNNIPPSVRQHPWNMDTIMTSAFPGLKPAPRFVAAVLRDMGFAERRDWTRAGRNRRQWLPPAETK